MFRRIKQMWSPQVAKAFLITWLTVASLAGVLVLIGQQSLGGRVGAVERVQVEVTKELQPVVHNDKVVLAGKPGPVGPRGATGARGPRGATGARGSQGPRGSQGSAGQRGSRGPAGATGARGPSGVGVGIPGPRGPAGPQGAPGLRGGVGPSGPLGPEGPPGKLKEIHLP